MQKRSSKRKEGALCLNLRCKLDNWDPSQECLLGAHIQSPNLGLIADCLAAGDGEAPLLRRGAWNLVVCDADVRDTSETMQMK